MRFLSVWSPSPKRSPERPSERSPKPPPAQASNQQLSIPSSKMGSLMAGWDSIVLDSKIVKSKRNRSLTKEEIESFWQSYKPYKHQHHHPNQQYLVEIRIKSAPNLPRVMFPGTDCPVDPEKAYSTSDWWTRSNCAFLNEPSYQGEANEPRSNYKSQFHIANKCMPVY